MQRSDWVVDQSQYPLSLAVCRLVAQWCDIPYLPKTAAPRVQRRAFLSDPTHPHVFTYAKHGHGSINELWLSVWPVVFSSAVISRSHDF